MTTEARLSEQVRGQFFMSWVFPVKYWWVLIFQVTELAVTGGHPGLIRNYMRHPKFNHWNFVRHSNNCWNLVRHSELNDWNYVRHSRNHWKSITHSEHWTTKTIRAMKMNQVTNLVARLEESILFILVHYWIGVIDCVYRDGQWIFRLPTWSQQRTYILNYASQL